MTKQEKMEHMMQGKSEVEYKMYEYFFKMFLWFIEIFVLFVLGKLVLSFYSNKPFSLALSFEQ